MISKINELFEVKISKEGKELIQKWLIDEFESLYYAKKQLDSDEAVKDFINDMLAGNNMELSDLCSKTTVPKSTKPPKKEKHFRFCPYCGENIER